MHEYWDSHHTLAEFAINTATWTLGDDLTPFFIDRGVHLRQPEGCCLAQAPLVAPSCFRFAAPGPVQALVETATFGQVVLWPD